MHPISFGRAADGALEHLVHFYDSERVLCDAVAEFLADGLNTGEAVVVIATRAHVSELKMRLEQRNLDLEAARRAGELTILDAEECLSLFMIGEMPDRARFRSTIGPLFEENALHGRRVRAFGEMVDVLWRAGNRRAAIRLEELWNELGAIHRFRLYCAYVMGNFYKEADLRDVCRTHTRVVTNPRVMASAAQIDNVVQTTSPAVEYSRSLAAEIGERKVIEDALRESLRELRKSADGLRDVVENAPIGMHGVDADGTILWANAAELALLGYEGSEYIGKNIVEVHADPQAAAEILARLANHETIVEQDVRLRAKDGSIRHVRITSNGCFEDGALVHTRCFSRDVSSETHAQDALRKNEELARTIADALPALVAYLDKNLRYRSVNRAYEQWFGVPRAQLVGRHIQEVLGEGYEAVRGYLERALAGERVSFEAQVAYQHGGPRYVSAVYVPHLAADGTVEGFVALVSDATDRKRHEDQRAAAVKRTERLMMITAAIADAVTSEQVYAAVVDGAAAAVQASRAGLWILDEERRVLRRVRGTGYPEEIKKRFETLSLDGAPTMPLVDAVLGGEALWFASHQEVIEKYPRLAPTIEPGGVFHSACLPVVVQGQTLGVLGFSFDNGPPIDAEHRGFLLLVARYAGQALERLRLLEAERKARAAAEASAARMEILSRDNHEARVRAEMLYDLARLLIEACTVDDVFSAALSAITRALGADRSAILVFDEEGVMRFRAWRGLSDRYRTAVEGHSPWPRDAKDPQPIFVSDPHDDPVLCSFGNLFDSEQIRSLGFIPLVAGERLVGKFMVYYRGRRELSPQERELARAIANHAAAAIARFSAVDELQQTVRFNEMFTAILGHDLRNPLGAIMTAAQVALKRGDGEKILKPLARILNSGERMARMIDQLLDFTRVRVGEGIPLHAREADLVPVLRQVIDELDDAHPEWKLELVHSGDTSGSWDVDRLSQVFSNLVGNALQHGVPEKGVHVSVDGSSSEQVAIEVHNMGAVPHELLPKLFEPMTGGKHRREKSHGLGLGLFISQRIAEAHGGAITVRSTEEGGTTFVVVLPRARSTASVALE